MRFINRNLVLALCFFSISATLFAQEIIKDSVKTVKPQSVNQRQKIDGIIEKIKREHEKLENLKKEVIKEGKYAEWEKMNTDLENSISIDKEKLKGLLESLNEILEKLLKGESENSYLILSGESELTAKATYSFLIIFKIYVNNLSLLPELKTYSENNDLAKDGDGVTYFYNH